EDVLSGPSLGLTFWSVTVACEQTTQTLSRAASVTARDPPEASAFHPPSPAAASVRQPAGALARARINCVWRSWHQGERGQYQEKSEFMSASLDCLFDPARAGRRGELALFLSRGCTIPPTNR